MYDSHAQNKKQHGYTVVTVWIHKRLSLRDTNEPSNVEKSDQTGKQLLIEGVMDQLGRLQKDNQIPEIR